MNSTIRITVPRSAGPFRAEGLHNSAITRSRYPLVGCAWFAGPDFDLFVFLYLRIVLKNIILKRSVTDSALEPVSLHLGIGAFGVPAVVIHSIHCSHDA